ncbi:Bifunctional protein HldE [Luteitalea pratensis]|uniref:Bifunctional protein HldE n=1 Tax=Luteitalea pratensis TaxID=1855912 RepID=A0A143PUD3_LUTPR|nr:PfkB family carbohydrate kinase [Luteitalea pratensis]AMY11788.1 Bifunctional protein HldE [Luteitalea pratensis]
MRERLIDALDALAGRRTVVVGDIAADEFLYGRVARVSREAPVLILEYDTTLIVPGGAGNAANNVAALGGRTSLFGCVGRDAQGARLVEALAAAGVDARGVVRVRGHVTTTKTRVLAGGIHSAKQQVVRIDRKGELVAPRTVHEAWGRRLDVALASCDAVLISDYGGGVVTPALVRHVKRTLRLRKGRQIPILVDSRYDLGRYQGLTASTPNESEVEAMLGVRIGDDRRVLERAGRTVLQQTRMAAVLVTRGSRGMALFEADRPTVHIPIVGSDEIADVTGAGDTVIATVTQALASGASFEDAAHLANYAGGLVVMKRGTATVSRAELRLAIEADR